MTHVESQDAVPRCLFVFVWWLCYIIRFVDPVVNGDRCQCET